MWAGLPSDAMKRSQQYTCGWDCRRTQWTGVSNIHVDGTAVGRSELASALYMCTELPSDAKN